MVLLIIDHHSLTTTVVPPSLYNRRKYQGRRTEQTSAVGHPLGFTRRTRSAEERKGNTHSTAAPGLHRRVRTRYPGIIRLSATPNESNTTQYPSPVQDKEPVCCPVTQTMVPNIASIAHEKTADGWTVGTAGAVGITNGWVTLPAESVIVKLADGGPEDRTVSELCESGSRDEKKPRDTGCLWC